MNTKLRLQLVWVALLIIFTGATVSLVVGSKHSAKYKLNRQDNLRQIAVCVLEHLKRTKNDIHESNNLLIEYPELKKTLRSVARDKVPNLTDYIVDTDTTYLVREDPTSFAAFISPPYIECFVDSSTGRFGFHEFSP